MQLERKTKLSPFLDDRIVYVEYTKEPSPSMLPLTNTVKLISKCIKATRPKFSIEKLIPFYVLTMNNKNLK